MKNEFFDSAVMMVEYDMPRNCLFCLHAWSAKWPLASLQPAGLLVCTLPVVACSYAHIAIMFTLAAHQLSVLYTATHQQK